MGVVFFVVEQHSVRVQVHNSGDPAIIPEIQKFSIPETQQDSATTANTSPEVIVIPETQADN